MEELTKKPIKILELQTRDHEKANKRKKDLELHIKSGAPISHRKDFYIIKNVELIPFGKYYWQLYFTGTLVKKS